MFGKFKELFGSENLLDSAFEVTMTMLEFDYKMYKASRKTLRESDTDKLPFDIRKTDRKINKYEREVRRKVLTHLTIAGPQNLAPGLALATIVIDVERIGDYTKNIYDLARKHKLKLSGERWEEQLQQIEVVVHENFRQTADVLENQSRELGRKVMQVEDETSILSDSIVCEILTSKDDDLKVADAVTLAMYCRYLKRINCHLTNIASSIVNPFPRIGFREKRKKK